MKQLILAFLIAAFLTGCSGKSTGAGKDAQSAISAGAVKTVTVAIEGMSCTGCENTIQEAVAKIPGVTSIKASHLDSTAVVSFDSTKTTLAVIGKAVDESGYVFKGEKTAVTKTEIK